MATIPPALLSLFEPVCKRLHAAPPQIEVPEAPDENGGYVVTASITLAARTFTAKGDHNGWFAISARQALLRLLKTVDPSATFHPELFEAPRVIEGATTKLAHACIARGLGVPSMKNAPSLSVALPERCEVTIQGLPGQSFFGQGLGYAEAKAIAATHALPVIERLPLAEGSQREIRGPIANLLGFVFTTREPKGWLSDWCRFHHWEEPSYTVASVGKLSNPEFASTVTVTYDGKPLRETSAMHSSKPAAERDASLRALRRVAPEIQFPEDIEPTPAMAFTQLIQATTASKVGQPKVSSIVDLSLIPHHICTLTIGVLNLSYTARGYSEQEAKAIAAVGLMRELDRHKNRLDFHKNKAAEQSRAAAAANAEAAAKKQAAALEAGRAAAARRQGINLTEPPPPPEWMRQAGALLQGSLKWLGGKIRLSPNSAVRGEWLLRLETGLTLTLAAPRKQCLKLQRVRDRKEVELDIPERIKERLLSLECNESDLASSLREHFIKPIEDLYGKAKPSLAPAVVEAPAQVISRLVAQPQVPTGRKEIEADPFVKAATGFFREGFLAACDNEGRECPWGVESLRRIDWQQGYDYAQLCCSKCGANNKEGARCAMPAPLPEVTPEPRMTDKLSAMLGRWDDRREDPDKDVDQSLIREAIRLLGPIEIRESSSEPRFEPVLCLACARKEDRPRGVLCLNPGFALSHLKSLDQEAAIAPYKSVALYGLRRRPKADFWAYVVMTNGAMSHCLDEDIAPYRGTEEIIERSVLTEATLNPSRRSKL